MASNPFPLNFKSPWHRKMYRFPILKRAFLWGQNWPINLIDHQALNMCSQLLAAVAEQELVFQEPETGVTNAST